MKGVGILLVILGHCMLFENPINRIIYSFHMPLFFILSGYVYNIKYKDLQKEFIFKKLKMLLYYFILPTSIFMLITPLFFKLGFYNHSFTNIPENYNYIDLIIQYLKSLIYLDKLPLLVAQVWFVRTLFINIISFNFINKLLKTNILKKQLIISIIYFSIFLFLQSKGFSNLWVNIFLSYPFIYMGYLFKEKNILTKLDNIFKNNQLNSIYMVIIVIFMFLFGIFYPKNIIDFYSSQLESVFYLCIMLPAGLILTYLIAEVFNEYILNFFGKNSIKILIIHGVILKFITFSLVYLMNVDLNLIYHYVPPMNFQMVLLYFIICSITSYILIYLYNTFKKIIDIKKYKW